MDWEQSRHVRRKQFRSLKTCFSAKPKFSSSYWENNVSGPQVYPHIDFAWIGSSPGMCEENNFLELEKLFFCKARFHPIRGHTTKKWTAKGICKLHVFHISSNVRIWQSYSRVRQILKVLCAWYSWKYVAHLGFEPLKFLYSEFLYNTQAVFQLDTEHLQTSWQDIFAQGPAVVPVQQDSRVLSNSCKLLSNSWRTLLYENPSWVTWVIVSSRPGRATSRAHRAQHLSGPARGKRFKQFPVEAPWIKGFFFRETNGEWDWFGVDGRYSRVDPVYPTLLQSKRIRLRFAPDVDGERRSEKVGTWVQLHNQNSFTSEPTTTQIRKVAYNISMRIIYMYIYYIIYIIYIYIYCVYVCVCVYTHIRIYIYIYIHNYQ